MKTANLHHDSEFVQSIQKMNKQTNNNINSQKQSLKLYGETRTETVQLEARTRGNRCRWEQSRRETTRGNNFQNKTGSRKGRSKNVHQQTN